MNGEGTLTSLINKMTRATVAGDPAISGRRRRGSGCGQLCAQFQPPRPHYDRGYGKLFLDHVTQANEGYDFDFLRAGETDGSITMDEFVLKICLRFSVDRKKT